ncbi:MAG: hypothetical protein WC523_01960 [Patescibacteria group bacterium]|jgi:predicted glycosyl hydrolase (DUF1957 family)
MFWLNFLHFYQPANAEFYNIRKALDKSYWRLLRLMEEHPEIKMTFNVSGCLLDRLAQEKETAFLERLKFLVKKGRVELVGSAYYHGFLPLLPEVEVIRQIKENEKALRKYFGAGFKPSGFFLPEMGYSPEVAKLIKRLGYNWIIVDEIAFNGQLNKRPDFNQIYLDENSGLKVIFRDRELSNVYPPDKLLALFKIVKKSAVIGASAAPKLAITATDAELYGLRHEDPTGELEKIVKNKELKTLTLSGFIKQSAKQKPVRIKLIASSWESSASEVRDRHPYKLWQDKNNKIHSYLWKLAYLSLALGEKYKKDKNYYWHRWHLARGLASCTFWWASARDFSKTYGPYAWSPDDIDRGLEDLIRSVRSFFDQKTKKKKLEAEKYYLKIKKLAWEKHWQKHWKKQYE